MNKNNLVKRLFKVINHLILYPMSQTVTYTNTKNYDSSDDRPYAEVIVHGNNGKKTRLFCLVDTGADDIQIHKDIASSDLDIDLNIEAASTSVATASGGSSRVYIMSNVKMKIEGKIIREDLIFGQNSIPIIGRRTILTAYEIGFNTNQWLYE